MVLLRLLLLLSLSSINYYYYYYSTSLPGHGVRSNEILSFFFFTTIHFSTFLTVVHRQRGVGLRCDESSSRFHKRNKKLSGVKSVFFASFRKKRLSKKFCARERKRETARIKINTHA